MYKIAIAGASSLLGRELKDILSESQLADAELVLLDEEVAQGQLDQVGDEATFIQAISADAFERADFAFFCGSEELTRRHWQQAARSGATVLDLTGVLDQEAGVLVLAPWSGVENAPVDLMTPAVVVAHPAAVVAALLLGRIQQSVPIRSTAATVLVPASEFGRAAMDELHQQTISLFNFQSIPRDVYDAQVAYNLLAGLGEEAKVSLSAVEQQIRRHYEAATSGRGTPLALQLIHAPVFHGLTFSIVVDLERPVEVGALEEALTGEHVEVILEETDSPSNLAATGQDDLLVRLRQEPGLRNAAGSSRFWMWVAVDNLRLRAESAVQCALYLRRLRPKGTVQ